MKIYIGDFVYIKDGSVFVVTDVYPTYCLTARVGDDLTHKGTYLFEYYKLNRGNFTVVSQHKPYTLDEELFII